MAILILAYLIFLLIYAFISYAIAFQIRKHRVEGDNSNKILTVYFTLSAIIIVGSIFFLIPF